jgi:hypothetical protein
MKLLKQTSFLIVMVILMASFSQCSTAQKLQRTAPTQFGNVYCQTWVAGVKGGGSGLNVFIPVMDMSIQLDSVYFRGKSVKLEVKKTNEGLLYIGRFKTQLNQPKDIIISRDANEEYKNQLPIIEEKIPFELNDDECVVTYKQGDKTQYYKITNIEQKRAMHYPSAPPNKTIKLN